MEVGGYAKYGYGVDGVEAINAALTALRGSSSSILPKVYDGQKLTQIQKMFKFLVPEAYVPDKYEVSSVTSLGEKKLQLRAELAPFVNLQRASKAAVQSMMQTGGDAAVVAELQAAHAADHRPLPATVDPSPPAVGTTGTGNLQPARLVVQMEQVDHSHGQIPPRSMWAAPAIPLKRAQQDNVRYILENFDPPLGGVWKANIDTPGITQLREYLEANWTGEGLPLKGGAAPLSPYVGYAATSDKYSETTQKLNTLGISGSETRRQSCLQHLPGLGAIHSKVCIELIKQLNLSELPKLHNFHILRQYHEADGGSGFGPHIDEADDSGGPPAFSVVVKLTADPPGSSGSWMQVLEPEPFDPVRYDADAGSSTIFLSRRYHQSLRTPLDMGKVLKLVLFFNYKAPNNSKKSTQSSSQPSQGSSKPTMNEAHKNKASTSKSAAQRKRPAPATASVKATATVDPSTQADLGCRVTAGCVLGRAHWGECSVPEDATLGGRKRRGAK